MAVSITKNRNMNKKRMRDLNDDDYKYAVGGYKAYPRFHHVHGEEEIR